jgi:chromosome partitioning protein
MTVDNSTVLEGMKIIALANQKGGVGKTTTAINLSSALAMTEKKVLLIDLDPQGNATTGLGVQKGKEKSSYDLFHTNINVETLISPTSVDFLDVIPASMDLTGLETEFFHAENRSFLFKTTVYNNLEFLKKYDYIFIDCPPSMNLITINALSAASDVLVPLQSEFFALEGLSQLMSTISMVQKKLNETLKMSGIILTMYDKRNNLSKQVEEDVREYLGDLVYQTTIPRNIRVSEAPSHGLPALLYDHQCSGSQAYVELAGEFIKREKHKLVNVA